MNSSAKKTAFSLLAAMALGAAAWMGCTVTSGTTDDVNGGTGNTDIDSGTGTTGDGGTTTQDSGTGPVGTVCKTNQQSVLSSETCQLCLENNCCTQLKGCFDDISGDPDAGVLGCNDYVECIDQGGSVEECDGLAAPGIPAAYDAIVTCSTTSCAAECAPSEVPDGG